MANENINETYGIDDISGLSTKDAYRLRIGMYLGSDDTNGIYQSLKEIINNSTDEALAGYGKCITIKLDEAANTVEVTDEGRGVPFGQKDGKEVLVEIFTKSHMGGKFNKKVYKTSSGLNGIGGTAANMSSELFIVRSYRDGQMAEAVFKKGDLDSYKVIECKNHPTGTVVKFKPDKEVFKNMTEGFSFEKVCADTKNISYLNKGIKFVVTNGEETKEYYSEGGIMDYIMDNITKPLMPKPIYAFAKDDTDELEIAMIYTGGQSAFYVFVNGLYVPQGGAPVTSAKRKITTKMKSLSGKKFSNDTIHKGLVYVINCKVMEPSFEGQVKSKINNANLGTLATAAFDEALEKFSETPAFSSIIEMMSQFEKAEEAAEKARDAVLNQAKKMTDYRKQKVAFMDKLHDAEHLGPDSVLCLCEGQSAANAVLIGRDTKTTGVMELRGKMLNGLKEQNAEKYFNNHEIELLIYALGININSYSPKNLRYGKIYICVDADDDGFHIALLILANLHRICPQFLKENRVYWLRCPLFLEYNKTEKLISWYYTNSEYETAKAKGKITGKIERAKGLGLLEEPELTATMFSKNGGQRLEQIIYSEEGISQLRSLMGEDVAPRKEFCMSRIDFSKYNIG